MKAIVYEQYGSPDVVELREIETPKPGDNQVLVKIYASAVNHSTLLLLSGKLFILRLLTGLFKPKLSIPGGELAGEVVEVGKKVTQFKPGDAVYGDLSDFGRSAFAEYVCTSPKHLAHKPASLSFEDAAAVPESALVAFQALRDIGNIRQGQKVLIYGASGGIGSFAVQFAKYFGAEVTGVCSSKNLDFVKSIGADYSISYTEEDFTKNGVQYDLIVSTAGYRSIFDYNRALAPGGRCVVTGGKGAQIFEGLLLGPWLSLFTGKKMSSLAVKPNKDLDLISEVLESGKVKPVIDTVYPLSQAAEAMKYYAKGHSRGRVVITVQPH